MALSLKDIVEMENSYINPKTKHKPYPGYCAGENERRRRLWQIVNGTLQVSKSKRELQDELGENVIFD